MRFKNWKNGLEIETESWKWYSWLLGKKTGPTRSVGLTNSASNENDKAIVRQKVEKATLRLTDGIERNKKESLDLTQYSPGMSPVIQCSEDNKFWYLFRPPDKHIVIAGLVAPWDIWEDIVPLEILVLYIGRV